jgi:capsular exopolysaccharide synthesis family protein
VEVKQVLWAFWRSAWLILLCIALAVGIAFGVSLRLPATYDAAVTLLVQAPTRSTAPDYDSLRASESLAYTYAQMVQQRPVLDQVIANLYLDLDFKTLAKQLHVEVVRDTQLIVVTVEHAHPQLAASIANEIARVFIHHNQQMQTRRYAEFKAELQQELTTLQADIASAERRLRKLQEQSSAPQADVDRVTALLSQYRLTQAAAYQSLQSARLAEVQSMSVVNIVEPAIADKVPAYPDIALNIVLASIVGATLAGSGIFLREYVNDRIRDVQDLRAWSDLPLLAVTSQVTPGMLLSDAVSFEETDSLNADAYHAVCLEIERIRETRPVRVVCVASSHSGDGRTFTAVNLGVAMARSGYRVVLVGADIRRPDLQEYFSLDNPRGLTALLSDDELPFSSYLCESGIPNLRVLPAGQATANPTNLFTAHRLTVLLDRFEDTDLLLLDGPAILDAPDALLLARLSDLVLLVVRAGRTRYSDVTQSCTQLQQLGAQIGGIVLNHTLQRWIRRNRKSSRAIQRGTSQHERAEDWHPSAHPPA